MTNLVKFPNLRRAREAASTWIARIDRELTADELRELQSWLSESPQHRQLLLEAATLWDQMHVLRKLSNLFPLDSPQPARVRLPWKSLTAVAASIALVTVFLHRPEVRQLQLQLPNDSPAGAALPANPAPLTYRTVVGQQSLVSLADGTRIHLNTDSMVEVEYSARSRRVSLVRGEALFEVAKDASRPFDVHTGSHVVRAVGTAFNVRVSSSAAVEVTVTEGRIRMLDSRTTLAPGESGMESPTAVAGQFVSVSGTGEPQVRELNSEELSDRVAWQKGTLVFHGQPLRTVLQEFSRYSDRKLAPSDDSIGDIPVSGFYRATDVDGLLVSLRENFGLRTRLVGDTVMIARKTDDNDSQH